MSPDTSRIKGKINKAVGIATGDRKQEAIGTVQEREGRDPDPAEVEQAIDEVKADHHDFGDEDADDARLPPQHVPHDDRD